MAEIQKDAPAEPIPPSFVTVTEELRSAVEISSVCTSAASASLTISTDQSFLKLPRHVKATFENGAVLPYPLVIHPSLDLAAETLQRSLQAIYESQWNLNSLEATFTESVRAFDVINTSLFLNPRDTIKKSAGFIQFVRVPVSATLPHYSYHFRNIAEFRRLYLRHSALIHACQWIAITLIGPHWLAGFKEVCHYLAQTVERIVRCPGTPARYLNSIR